MQPRNPFIGRQEDEGGSYVVSERWYDIFSDSSRELNEFPGTGGIMTKNTYIV